MRKVMATALAVLLAAGPAAAQAPSFDCRLATRPDETAICRSPALARDDARLADLFSTVTGCLMMGSRDVEKTMQWRWLQRRARCGANTACLARLYRARIAEYAPRAARARKFMTTGDCPNAI